MAEQLAKKGKLTCGQCGSTDIWAVLTVLDYYDAPDGDEEWAMYDTEGEGDLDQGLAIELLLERNHRRDGECIESQLLCTQCGSGNILVKDTIPQATAAPSH
jgi:ribosomal protein S27AE